MEILNYHSHNDHNITVKVKDDTRNFLLRKVAYIVNITQVTLETYSNDEKPCYADIIIKEQDVVMITSKSKFNIMKHVTLRLLSVLNQENMHSDEYETGMQ